MSVATPWILLGLALLVPAFVSFIVRNRRDTVHVPSTMLWARARGVRVVARRFRRLTQLLAALLCLAAIAGVVVAAARPGGAGGGGTLAVVIDTSASMGSTGAEVPIERARELVDGLLASRRPGQRIALIAAGPRPRTLAPPTDDEATLVAARDAIAADATRADVRAAVDLARRLLAAEPAPRILVLSDGQPSTFDLGRGEAGVEVHALRLGDADRPNAGIAAMSTRPSERSASSEELDVDLDLTTSATGPREVRIVMTGDGAVLGEKTATLEPGRMARVSWSLRASVSELRATIEPIDGNDALAADDTATVSLGKWGVTRALVIDGAESTPAFFIDRALRAAGVGEVIATAPGDAKARASEAEVAVVVGPGPEEALGIPTLFVATAEGYLPGSGASHLDGSSGKTRLRSLTGDHELLRGVRFDDVTIDRAVALELDPARPAESLMALDGGTVIAAGTDEGTPWVYLGVEPQSSDLVLKVAFPVLVANAVTHLAGNQTDARAATLPIGEIALATQPDPEAASTDDWTGETSWASIATLIAAMAALGLAFEGFLWWRQGS